MANTTRARAPRVLTPVNTSPMLTVTAVAERLQVSERTIRRWIDDGQLKAYRLSRAIRVSENDLQSFLARAP